MDRQIINNGDGTFTIKDISLHILNYSLLALRALLALIQAHNIKALNSLDYKETLPLLYKLYFITLPILDTTKLLMLIAELLEL